MKQKKFVLVGTGGRAALFLEQIASRFRADTRLCALCDTCRVRMDHYNMWLQEHWNCDAVPTYLAGDFEMKCEPENR